MLQPGPANLHLSFPFSFREPIPLRPLLVLRPAPSPLPRRPPHPQRTNVLPAPPRPGGRRRRRRRVPLVPLPPPPPLPPLQPEGLPPPQRRRRGRGRGRSTLHTRVRSGPPVLPEVHQQGAHLRLQRAQGGLGNKVSLSFQGNSINSFG